MALRAHELKHIEFLGSAGLTKILEDMINEDLSMWVGELTRAVQGDYSPAMPLPAGTVWEMLPLPALPVRHEFVRGGGTLFKLLRADISRGGAVTGSGEKLRGKGVAATPKPKRRRSKFCHASRDFKTCSYGNSCKFSNNIHEEADTSDAAGGGACGQGADGSAGTGAYGGGEGSTVVVLKAGGGERSAVSGRSARGAGR